MMGRQVADQNHLFHLFKLVPKYGGVRK